MEESTIKVSDSGWSATLTKYTSAEYGETVAVWVTAPDGTRAHAGSSRFPFTEEGALKAIKVYRELSKFLEGRGGYPTQAQKPSW